jgi:hypothetical protein
MSTISRDLEHPSWCVDHRHEMVGPHGECHSKKHHSLLDEHGFGLEAHVSWYDGDRGPRGFIAYLASSNGEQFAHLSPEAIHLLVDLLEQQPAEVLPMMRHLATSLASEAPA